MGTDDLEEAAENSSETVPGNKRSSDEKDALHRLSQKVDKARTQRSTVPHQRGRGTAIGLAYRLSIELVVGIVVGGYLGWWMDRFFGTKPLFLLLMLVLGMAAGVVNMLRTSREMNKRMGLTDTPGSDDPTNEE
ncbi:MAG: AtpZ/AtpI family protein [Parvibaculales bacterium]